MALTDNPRMSKKKRVVRAADAGTNKSWGDKQKIEAVKSFLALGNLALTGRVLNIPEITLRVWKRSEWWHNMCEEIKSQEKIQLSARLAKIVDASLVAAEDRILNGDFVFDQKTSQMIRKPISLRDAHKVATDLIDKRAVIDKTADVAEKPQGADQLEQLAEKFAAFVNKKIENKQDERRIIEAETVEVKEPENALYEERKA